MKKISLFILVLIFANCTQKDEIKEKVINAVKINLKNPDSFEFVNYEVFKTVNFKEAKIGLPIIKEMIRISTGLEKVKYQKQFEFVNSAKNESDIAYYDTYLVAKGTNSFGAIIQSKYYVKVLNNKTFDIVVLKEK
ncbi:hypothetical protein [Flavobacterium sp.]|uniref:hypothetical protein n=1 Tax=Flavobacterium sp. TaxID=239 RepID=UPI002B4AC6D7|nr:hypothetical protein [Flavobacterium sp.]HLF51064.1 hypothetical protein [Flavobacterium sp.]